MSETLLVKIIKAKDLKDADGRFSGKSDPYVRLKLLDHAGDPLDQTDKCKRTTTKQNTNDPFWDETYTFGNLSNPCSYKLKLNVLDKDYFTRDDDLGDTTIELGSLLDTDEWQQFNDLPIAGYIWKSLLTVHLNTKGSWGNGPGPLSLSVNVKRATGLKNADSWTGGQSDPYVRLTLQDETGRAIQTKQTSVKDEGGASVTWDELIIFEDLAKPAKCKLALQVLDKDQFTKDDALGKEVTIHLGMLPYDQGWTDYDDLKIDDKAKLSVALTTDGGWGNSKRHTFQMDGACCACTVT